MNFRKITFFICFSLFAVISFGQNNYEEVVYLKNGSVIHGVIIEQIPNTSIKIKTNDGNIFVFKMDEIEKITKELPVTTQKVKNTKMTSSQKGNLFFGIKSGINLTDFTNNSGIYDEQFIPRFQASIVLRKCFTNVISFQPELQYSRQGFLIKDNNSSYELNFVSEYLNLSPQFRFDLGKNHTKFILMIGPYLGYWVTGKSEFSYNANINSISISDWSPWNRIEIGGSVGFGISQSLKNNDQIIVDSKLSYGFNGVLKNVDASNNSNNLYNSFSVGYLHNF